MMSLDRREFLKVLGATTTVGSLGLPRVAGAVSLPDRIKTGKETTTICPYCGVGCGIMVTVNDDKVVNTEGDPDHPINQGALCSKGAALSRIFENPYRLTRVLYRAPGAVQFVPKPWNWAVREIAKRVKATRDATFVEKEGDRVVNRTAGMACFGGAALDNEEAYLLGKTMRALGLTHIEHQARI
jgi:formate dehydrogenase major subunit